MVKLFLALPVVLLLSCVQSNTDKIKEQEISIRADSMVRGIMEETTLKFNQESEKELLEGMQDCPILVKGCKVWDREYSGKNIAITVTNKSTKPIDGIKYIVYFSNNFGEYVNGSSGFPFATLLTQETLNPGKSSTYQRHTTNFDQATKGRGYIREVHFTDGTTWKNIND